ncbi:UNVERIFIED_CONTAM: hypothetical protein FKN15_001182 [Acipenser sinensis]
MAVAVSSITYLRGIFPEDAYRIHYLEGLCKICFNSTELVIIFRMTGCFDALEKGYSIIESYQFKFRYTPDGPQLDILSNKKVELKLTMKDTKKASVLLIRKLFLLMQNLDTLPNDVSLTIKLYYYDDGSNDGSSTMDNFIFLTVGILVGLVLSRLFTSTRSWLEYGNLRDLLQHPAAGPKLTVNYKEQKTQGPDSAFTGKGPDSAFTGKGPDSAFTGKGPDSAFTGKGPDSAFTGKGPDSAFTGKGPDSAFTGKGPDSAFTGKGPDSAFTGKGPDSAFTGKGPDSAFTGKGPDSAFTGKGPDSAFTGKGPDSAFTGKGPDSAFTGNVF